MLASPLDVDDPGMSIHICQDCRRFWLERNGWLLSRRETIQVLRTVRLPEAGQTLVR